MKLARADIEDVLSMLDAGDIDVDEAVDELIRLAKEAGAEVELETDN